MSKTTSGRCSLRHFKGAHLPPPQIQLLHKHPAHLHALDIKDAQKQRDPGIKPLEGMTTSKLADKYIVKQNKIRNQCTLLRGQVEDGVVFFLNKVEETIRAVYTDQACLPGSSEWHDKLFRLQQSREIDMMPVPTLATQHWKRPHSAHDGLSPTKVPAHAGGGKKASSAANMALNIFLDLHPISGALLLQHALVQHARRSLLPLKSAQHCFRHVFLRTHKF